MSYTTQQEIEDRYGTERVAELTRDAQGQQVNADLLTDAIEEIAAKTDAALRVIDDPANFDQTNTLLRGLNTEGAYLLLVKWSEGGWTEDDREDFETIKDDLKAISAGRIILKNETDQEKEDRLEGFFSSDPKLFGRKKTAGHLC